MEIKGDTPTSPCLVAGAAYAGALLETLDWDK